MRSLQSAVDGLSSHIALLDQHGAVFVVNKAWRDFSVANGGEGDYVGWNYLEVCRRSVAEGSKAAARALAGLTRVVEGASDDFGFAYECYGAIFRLHVMPIQTDEGRQVLIAHENITELVKAQSAFRGARLDDERLVEELGQRLAAIDLAIDVIRREGADGKALSTIDLALDEAWRELEKIRGGLELAVTSPSRPRRAFPSFPRLKPRH